MLTDKELDQIRAIMHEEICKTCNMLAEAIDDGLREYFGAFIRALSDAEPEDARQSYHVHLEYMADIDRRNDERIAEWQTRKEEES